MEPEWVLSIRDQCKAANIPFFFKQWGGRRKKEAGRTLAGKTYDEVPERPDDEQVDRHPDRSPPVGVAAEHAGVRLGRQVVHAVLLAAYVQDERMLLVELGERADSIGAQELVLVEHLGEDPAQPFRVEQGRDPALGYTKMSRARGVDGLLEFGYPPQAFIHSSHRPRDTLPHRLFENRRRAQGQEAHH